MLFLIEVIINAVNTKDIESTIDRDVKEIENNIKPKNNKTRYD